jgi:hypothetical protein
MPGLATTVTAHFAYTGVSNGGGATVLPTPINYFKNGSIFTKSSDMEFTHVTVRDFNLFSHVTLNGSILNRNGHYTATRSGGFTEITLATGYLNSLANGTYTLIVHFSDQVTVTTRFTIVGTAAVQLIFSDASPGSWYYSSVVFVGTRDWMTADSNTLNFRPSAMVTQGEFIEAIYRMVGRPSVWGQNSQTPPDSTASIEWALSAGVLPSDGFISADSAISRQDAALMLLRLSQVMRMTYQFIRGTPVFTDEWQISAAARPAVFNAYRAGLMSGRTTNTFVPLGNMTRAECAVILHRYSEMVTR